VDLFKIEVDLFKIEVFKLLPCLIRLFVFILVALCLCFKDNVCFLYGY
jgi:hypothetical protein